MKIANIGGKTHFYQEGTMFSSWVPFAENEGPRILTVGESDLFRWTGRKIPWAVWAQVLSFMKWGQTEFKSEVHCSLFYNDTLNQWRPWAFPQTTAGMTVKLQAGNPEYKEQRKQFTNGWVLAGSVHHHCESSAFQSGTDSEDEKDKEGVHVTVGKTSSTVVDLHVRKTCNGKNVVCRMEEFFEPAPFSTMLPPHINLSEVDKFGYLSEPVPFPEQWKKNVKKETFPNARTSGPGHMGKHQTLLGAGLNKEPRNHETYLPFPIRNGLDKVDEILEENAFMLGCTVNELAMLWVAMIDRKPLTTEEAMCADLFNNALLKTGLRCKTIKAYLSHRTITHAPTNL